MPYSGRICLIWQFGAFVPSQQFEKPVKNNIPTRDNIIYAAKKITNVNQYRQILMATTFSIRVQSKIKKKMYAWYALPLNCQHVQLYVHVHVYIVSE